MQNKIRFAMAIVLAGLAVARGGLRELELR